MTIEKSEIGPNVSIEQGTKISGSRISHSIIGRDSTLKQVQLTGSMLGNAVAIQGFRGSASLSDNSELMAKPSS